MGSGWHGWGSVGDWKTVIFTHCGDTEVAEIRKNQLQNPRGNCDVPVMVEEARFDRTKISMRLREIGHPGIRGKTSYCHRSVDEVHLSVSGFGKQDPQEEIETALRQLLQTPEAYLAAHGIHFGLPASNLKDEVQKVTERHPKVTSPELLLSAEASFTAAARGRGAQDTVRCKLIVGTDGRVYEPHIEVPLDPELDNRVLANMLLWRF
jgi:hypothetical protein